VGGWSGGFVDEERAIQRREFLHVLKIKSRFRFQRNRFGLKPRQPCLRGFWRRVATLPAGRPSAFNF
jgi:hypothetical protein